jgi:glutamate 5-kinase
VAALVQDIASLWKQAPRVQVTLVSSGAVNLGRSALQLADQFPKVRLVNFNGLREDMLREQVLAAVGQPRLMAFYTRAFGQHGLTCSQILTTRRDFADRNAYLNLRAVTMSLLTNGVVPIFNENDVLSPEELDFSDNDQLAYMVAAMLVADMLVILTDVDGVYDRSPTDPEAQVIPQIENPGAFLDQIDTSQVSGKGGMTSKLLSADVITALGIPMRIANGTVDGIVSKIVAGEPVGTLCPAQGSRKDAVRTWLATAAASKGTVVVSTALADVLRQRRAASVLLFGIERVDGDFEKGDVVDVSDDDGMVFGRGQVRLGSNDLRQAAAEFRQLTDAQRGEEERRAGKRIAIHYNNFHYNNFAFIEGRPD